jgi:hypothetical protein
VLAGTQLTAAMREESGNRQILEKTEPRNQPAVTAFQSRKFTYVLRGCRNECNTAWAALRTLAYTYNYLK